MRALLVEVLVAQARPTLVTIAGEIDLVTAPALRRHLLALPERSTVLELSGVRLLSAAGLAELVDLNARLTRAGALIALTGASRTVRRMLAITGLDRVVALTETSAEAVRLMAGPTPEPRSPSSAATGGSGPDQRRDAEDAGVAQDVPTRSADGGA